MKYYRNSKNLEKARALRKNMTPQERHLWYDFLRYCTPCFRRQEILGNYIADFFCYKAKLVLEIDGSQHFEDQAKDYDNARTSYFHSLGIRVLRFSNTDINIRFRSVCEAVMLALKECDCEVSVNFDKATLSKVKFGYTDPLSTVQLFKHNMVFSENNGFKPVKCVE